MNFSYKNVEKNSLIVDNNDNMFIYLGVMPDTKNIILRYLSSETSDIEVTTILFKQIIKNLGPFGKSDIREARRYSDYSKLKDIHPEYFI